MSRVSGLGYIGATVTQYEPWHRLLQEVYGLEERSDTAAATHHYRLDAQHHRLALYEGERDAIAYVGWEVETRDALRALAAHLSDNGVVVETGDAALAAERAVMELIVFAAPDGVRTEAFFGPRQDSAPFTPTRAGRLSSTNSTTP